MQILQIQSRIIQKYDSRQAMMFLLLLLLPSPRNVWNATRQATTAATSATATNCSCSSSRKVTGRPAATDGFSFFNGLIARHCQWPTFLAATDLKSAKNKTTTKIQEAKNKLILVQNYKTKFKIQKCFILIIIIIHHF